MTTSPPDGTSTDRPVARLNKRQQQAAETRDRMLQSAATVFAEKGYQGASVGAITKQAETAHGTFYLYFKNKDDAFAQVIARVGELIQSESRARLSDDRYENVCGVIRGFLVVFVHHPGLMRALVEGVMLSPNVEEIWREVHRHFTVRIAHRLEREHEAGLVRSMDNEAAAHALASMVEWYAFTHLILGDTAAAPDHDDLDATVTTLADLWYHAVYGDVAS